MGNTESGEEERFYTPISPKIHYQPNFDLSKPIGSEGFHKQQNYGFLPLGCIHEILLYLEPTELFSCLASCKLINEVASTNNWWQSYYMFYFEDFESLNNLGDDEEKNSEKVNWKKMFCEKYSRGFYTDDFYRRFFMLVEDEEDNYTSLSGEEEKEVFKVPQAMKQVIPEANLHGRYTLIVAGSDNSGKDEFMKAVAKEFNLNFDDDGGGSERNVSFNVNRNYGGKRSRFHWNTPINDARVRFREFPRKKSKLDVEESLAMNPKYYGIFLCFSLNDRKSFNFALQKYSRILSSNEFLDQGSTMCLLVGIDVNPITAKTSSSSSMFKPKEIEEVVERKGFCGFVECSIEEKENDNVVVKSTNVLLSFGILLDSVIRRGKSISRLKTRKNMNIKEGKNFNYRNYNRERNIQRNRELRRRNRALRKKVDYEARKKAHERLKRSNIEILEEKRERWRRGQKN